MSNKLYATFARALGISEDRVDEALTYNTIPEWDSTAHMILIAELEADFDVMLDTDDIIDMSSVAEARRILSGHGVTLDG